MAATSTKSNTAVTFDDPRKMSREERMRRCGIDCPDAIVWRHWGVGGEYVKKLVLKNTHDKLQVIQHMLPKQKATFFVDFPKPVTLSSGMAHELIVRFRPTNLVKHQDSIEIEVKGRGTFTVDLVALTPYAKLDAPAKYDFNLCPVNSVSSTKLAVKNSGTLPLEVEWDVPAPFVIEPSGAKLAEGETMNINVSFSPTQASPMVAQATCKSKGDGELLSVVKLSGIGKYAFVKSLTDTNLDFGALLTSTSKTKTIVVQNKSTVDATFSLKRVDKDIVNPFQFTPTSGVIPRDGQQEFHVKYSPQSTSAHYTNDFVLKVVGGNEVPLRCTGTATGPSVTLSTRSLDFGDIDLENIDAKACDKYVVLKNKSDQPVQFQFVSSDPGGAFVITPFAGTLAPKKMQNINIRFAPNAPINYLRRLRLLVNHTDKALFLDLLGTAFDSKSRPAPFSHKHVRYYYERVAGGLARTTPDDIEKLYARIRDGVDPADEDEEAAREALQSALSNASAALKDKSEQLEMVLPAENKQQLPFSFDGDARVVLRTGEGKQIVSVRNHTGAKATAVWSVPENSPWTVKPLQADVSAYSTAQFSVSLKPGSTSSFGNYIECFCFYKAMRSFRLVSEETFTPSQCLSLLCQHITRITETSATPQVVLPSHVAFPAARAGDCVYQVVQLKNDGDTIVPYDVSITSEVWKSIKEKNNAIYDPEVESEVPNPQLGDVYQCYPSSGCIQPNGTQLVLFRFTPFDRKRFRGVATVTFNESSIGGRQIILRGEGFTPQLQLSNNNILTFRPTSVGGVTSRKYIIENPSRIPVRYTVQIPQHLEEVVSLEPSTGILGGCERIELDAKFCPQSACVYEMKVPLMVEAAEKKAGLENVQLRQICHVNGDGVVGVLSVEPLEIDFGSALVGADVHRTITIFNSSLCDVHFRLDYVLKSADTDGEVPPITFMPSNVGVLRARSHMNVEACVKLPSRGRFDYRLFVISGGSPADLETATPSVEDVERLPHCDVKIFGEHPTLEITDVRSVYQRKSHLWRQLSVTRINEVLRSVVIGQDVETKSFTFDGAVDGIAPVVCDLGVDVFRTAPIRVLLRLDNVSHCPVNFQFWFPHESDVPKEPWHQEEQATDLRVAEIIDRRLFDISPRQATIEPGGHQVILFTYQHTTIGQHTLPVLFRMDKGKRILMHLTARTLHESTKFLAFHHTLTHELLPVAIGDMEPPLQYSELQNLSHQPATYVIEQDSLRELRERNFDFPVFQCLNPTGTIPPMSTLLLSWYFRPLEAKRYSVEVKIRVEGGETYVLTLGGTGYHPKKVSREAIIAMHEKDVFPLPKYPTLQHPLLPLRLSMDVLRFNCIPFHSLHRQVINLNNTHPTDTFLFEWHCVLQYGDQMLDVDPPRGRIAPGESMQFRVTMYSGSTSHIIDNPIHCHVLNESLRRRRLERRAKLESDAAMALEQPAQNETAASGTSSLALAAEKAKSTASKGPRLRQAVTTIPAKFQSTGRLRQAIQQLTEAAVAEELDDDDDELTYVDVLPTVLEVLVQARIVPIDYYSDIYGEAAAKAHFYPTLCVYGNDSAVEEVEDVTTEEREIVTDVVNELLRQAVHSRAVKDAYTDVSEDPVPYFFQIRQQPLEGCGGGTEAPTTSVVEGEEVEEAQDEAEEKPESSAEAERVEGSIQCLLEEVVEGSLFNIVAEALSEEGVISAVQDNLLLASKSAVSPKRATFSDPKRDGTFKAEMSQEMEAALQYINRTSAQKKKNASASSTLLKL